MKHAFVLLFPAICLLFSCSKGNQSTTGTNTSSSPAKQEDCIDPSKIKKDQVCIEIYAPVCGCDGKTYGNSCIAENSGVTSYKQGECR